MVVSSVQRKLTYEDLLRIPEDGLRHEILDGVHVVSPAPRLRHQRVHHRFDGEVYKYLELHPVGELFPAPTDVLLAVHDVVEPDFVFVSTARLAILTEANVQGAPDLVVEILSPSTRRIDLGTKRSRYEALGVGEYWVLDPDEDTAMVFRRKSPGALRFQAPVVLTAEADDRLTSPLLPEFELPLRKLFLR